MVALARSGVTTRPNKFGREARLRVFHLSLSFLAGLEPLARVNSPVMPLTLKIVGAVLF